MTRTGKLERLRLDTLDSITRDRERPRPVRQPKPGGLTRRQKYKQFLRNLKCVRCDKAKVYTPGAICDRCYDKGGVR